MMSNNIDPAPVLVVQSTGSVKALVPLTCSVIDSGIKIIIENMLVLASDQSSKVDNLANQDVKDVKSYQLDDFKSDNELHSNRNSKTSIIVFLSPEMILKTVSINFIYDLVSILGLP